MFQIADSVSENRSTPLYPPQPTLQFFSLVSFGSWAKGILASGPHTLVPLWLYNGLYLNINYLCTWFLFKPCSVTAVRCFWLVIWKVDPWRLVFLSLGPVLFGGLIISVLRFCGSLGLGAWFIFPVCQHGEGRASRTLGCYLLGFFLYPPHDAPLLPYWFYWFQLRCHSSVTAFVLFSPAAVLLPTLGFKVPIEEWSGLTGNWFSPLLMLVLVIKPGSLKPTTCLE